MRSTGKILSMTPANADGKNYARPRSHAHDCVSVTMSKLQLLQRNEILPIACELSARDFDFNSDSTYLTHDFLPLIIARQVTCTVFSENIRPGKVEKLSMA